MYNGMVYGRNQSNIVKQMYFSLKKYNFENVHAYSHHHY